MLYQMTMDVPAGSTRDDIHRLCEKRFKTPTKDQERDYLWGFNADQKSITVRRRRFLDGSQTEVNIPQVDSRIRFDLSVCPKRGSTNRKSINSKIELEQWIERQFDEAGLFLLKHEVRVTGEVLIGNKNLWSMNEVIFSGRAIVFESKKFETMLIKGFPSMGKCWGFGFLHFEKAQNLVI